MLTFHEILMRLLFAAGMGALIGIERDMKRRPAGVRTSMFVCLATALFTIMSGELSHLWGEAGATRIASNIVQGIGFLGAGAIIKESGGLVGMTTAATIFVEAAIGMAAGGGFYWVALTTTGIVIFALFVLAWVAERLNLRARVLLFRVTSEHTENVAAEVQQLFGQLQIRPIQFRTSMSGTQSIVEFQAEVNRRQQEQIVAQLHRERVVTEIVPFPGFHE